MPQRILGTLLHVVGTAITLITGVVMVVVGALEQSPAGPAESPVSVANGQMGQGVLVGMAGVAVALSPLLTRVWNDIWTDRREARQFQAKLDKAKEAADEAAVESARIKAEATSARAEAIAAKADADAAKVRIKELEEQTAEIPVNTAKQAATQGQADAVLEILQEKGWLAPPKARSGQRGPRPTVLIVEDDPDTARQLMRLFTREGYSASHAATVADGVDKARLGPHFLILDLQIGAESGLEVLRSIRLAGLGTRAIVVTGTADPAHLAAARAEADAVLAKPVDLNELLRLMDEEHAAASPASPESGGG